MRFSKYAYMLIILFSLIGLSACNNQTPATGNPDDGNEKVNSSGSPTEIPVPPKDKGVLTGSLVQKGVDGNPDTPYEGLRVFLGSLIISEDGKSTLARVNSLEAPVTITDADGKFVFDDLDPATYILVLQVPPNMLIKLNDPETGKDMMIDIAGGEVTDIGPQYHDLPWFTVPTP